MKLEKDVLELKQEVCRLRRELHQIPEIGFEEFKTSEYIVKYLRQLGCSEISRLGKTGIKAVIRGRQGHKTLAFRADMDALLIEEKNKNDFVSRHEGKMHACGHDGHMSIILAFTNLLMKYKHRLNANVVLIFQPAEEEPGGAELMIEEGVLRNPKVDEIYGFHIFPELEQGMIGVIPGPFFARLTDFDISVKGKSAHGAMPHKGTDTILIVSQLINALQGIVSRDTDPLKSAVVTIGKITAGETRNILAENALLEGTMRTFDDTVHEMIKQKITKVTKAMDMIHGSKTEFIDYGGYPAVINDRALTDKVKNIIPDSIIEVDPVMIAEDFSFYQQEVPGVFMMLGSRNEEKGFIHPLHSNRFNFDEAILLKGVQTCKDLIKEYLV
ncbi:MAG: amidohydrolase [Clostridia bacterium]|nr:amidohydrolase [Clostridia bacterium]